MFNFENIFAFFCRKLRHIAGQLRLFEINQTKINRVVGLQKLDNKKTAKNVYLGVTGLIVIYSMGWCQVPI